MRLSYFCTLLRHRGRITQPRWSPRLSPLVAILFPKPNAPIHSRFDQHQPHDRSCNHDRLTDSSSLTRQMPGAGRAALHMIVSRLKSKPARFLGVAHRVPHPGPCKRRKFGLTNSACRSLRPGTGIAQRTTGRQQLSFVLSRVAPSTTSLPDAFAWRLMLAPPPSRAFFRFFDYARANTIRSAKNMSSSPPMSR